MTRASAHEHPDYLDPESPCPRSATISPWLVCIMTAGFGRSGDQIWVARILIFKIVQLSVHCVIQLDPSILHPAEPLRSSRTCLSSPPQFFAGFIPLGRWSPSTPMPALPSYRIHIDNPINPHPSYPTALLPEISAIRTMIIRTGARIRTRERRNHPNLGRSNTVSRPCGSLSLRNSLPTGWQE